MKRILNYSRHWLASKGRHGTHSPFVYAFVEQVLRNKNKIKTEQVKQLPWPESVFSLRETKLLYKSLYFLKPRYVLLPEDAGLGWAKQVLPHIVTGAVTVPAGAFDYHAAGKDCLLLLPAQQRYYPDFERAIGAGISVLVVYPHRAGDPALWERLYTDPRVKMSLDYWYFGLLLNDIAFKQKQHFRLR